MLFFWKRNDTPPVPPVIKNTPTESVHVRAQPAIAEAAQEKPLPRASDTSPKRYNLGGYRVRPINL